MGEVLISVVGVFLIFSVTGASKLCGRLFVSPGFAKPVVVHLYQIPPRRGLGIGDEWCLCSRASPKRMEPALVAGSIRADAMKQNYIPCLAAAARSVSRPASIIACT